MCSSELSILGACLAEYHRDNKGDYMRTDCLIWRRGYLETFLMDSVGGLTCPQRPLLQSREPMVPWGDGELSYRNVPWRSGLPWKAMSPTSLGGRRPTCLWHGPCPLPPFIQSVKNVVFSHLTWVSESEVYVKDSTVFRCQRAWAVCVSDLLVPEGLPGWGAYIMWKA